MNRPVSAFLPILVVVSFFVPMIRTSDYALGNVALKTEKSKEYSSQTEFLGMIITFRPFRNTLKQYGYVHALVPDSPNRLTECGKRTDTALGYWDDIDEPVNCPKCLKKMSG